MLVEKYCTLGDVDVVRISMMAGAAPSAPNDASQTQ